MASGLPRRTLLRDDPVFADVPLAPRHPISLAGAAGAVRLGVSCWNRLGGLLGVLSDALELQPAAAAAVMAVESGGNGFQGASPPRLMVRFEVHLFLRRCSARGISGLAEPHFRFGAEQPWRGHEFRAAGSDPWRSVHSSQESEWEALQLAQKLDEDAAIASTSLGAPQILGIHFATLGFSNPQAMLRAFSDCAVRSDGFGRRGEREQIFSFFEFLRRMPERRPMIASLRGLDFLQFARAYNGSGQARRYAERISVQYAALLPYLPRNCVIHNHS